jgi:hypothetical protein
MQRLNTHLAPLWADAHRQSTPDDIRQHQERVDTLLHDADNTLQHPIPEHLHRGGNLQIRQVTTDDIARLRLGRAIALATRALLPDGPGNQRLALAATHGLSLARMLGARRTKPHTEDHVDSAAETAGLSVLARGGACGEHAALALELARATGNDACLLNNTDDHSIVMLAPHLGQHAVVIDGWTTFPGSCLSADSTFIQAGAILPDTGAPAERTPFNLVTIERLRSRLEEELGPEPVMNAILEDRMSADFSPFPGPDFDEQGQQNSAESLLHNAASMLGSMPISELRLRQSDLAGNQRQTPVVDANVRQHLQGVAASTSDQLMPMVTQLARLRALQSPARRATVAVPITVTATLVGNIQGHIRLGLRAIAQPTVRDERLPSANILYCDEAGATFSTTTAPQQIIDDAQRGLDNAEILNFPDSFRAKNTVQARYALTRLQHYASRPSSALVVQLQRAALEVIDVNLPHMPIQDQGDMLLQLECAQLALQADEQQLARDMLARHYARVD